MFNKVIYGTDNIVDNYENDCIIIVPEFVEENNIKYLREKPSFPVGTKKRWKKAPFTTPRDKRYSYKYTSKYKYFSEQLHRLHKSVDDFVRRNFPNYIIKKTDHTFRITETYKEGLHFDVFAPHNYHSLRIFVNIDFESRIWNNSYFYEHYLYQCDKNKLHSPYSINKYINTHLLNKENIPKKTLNIKPFSMWLCNTELVSHEIVYGKKCVAFSYQCKVGSMNNYKKSFIYRFKKWHG